MYRYKELSKEEQRVEKLLRESFLGKYLDNDNITDISYDGTTLRIQDNQKGRYRPDEQPTYEEVFRLGKQIADLQGKEWTNSEPRLNTELSIFRVNYIHETVSPKGCTFSIRVSRPKLAVNCISDFGNDDLAKLLSVLVQAEFNLIISGRTGAGKTELQKLLINDIDDFKKISLIEDTMDSHIKEIYPDKDINSWRILTDHTRSNPITYQDLIREGLRNNPDWLIIAETRGSESYDVLESALTGHSIITTIHAKEASAIPSRLIYMIGQSHQVNELLLGQDITNTFKIGIYLTLEFKNNKINRFVQEVVEFTGFSEKGAEYTPIYQVGSKYDYATKEYVDVVNTNPLSAESLEILENKRLIHLVPEVFLGR